MSEQDILIPTATCESLSSAELITIKQQIEQEDGKSNRRKGINKKSRSYQPNLTDAPASSECGHSSEKPLNDSQGLGNEAETSQVFENEELPDENLSREVEPLHDEAVVETKVTHITRFCKPPERYPYSICFSYPQTFITHRFVFDTIKEKIQFVKGAGIDAIQNRNVFHGTWGQQNRWIVTLSCVEARDELIRLGLEIFKSKIAILRFDDVIKEEYRLYQLCTAAETDHNDPCGDGNESQKKGMQNKVQRGKTNKKNKKTKK